MTSGYLERSVAAIFAAVAKREASVRIHRFVAAQGTWLTNLQAQRLLDSVRQFDPQWASKLENGISGELADALDSVVARRNEIAHGSRAGISLGTLKSYFDRVDRVIAKLESICQC